MVSPAPWQRIWQSGGILTQPGPVWHLHRSGPGFRYPDPRRADTVFGKAHFWLHEVGVTVTRVTLPMALTGNHALEPVFAAAEGVIFLGIIAWTITVIRTVIRTVT